VADAYYFGVMMTTRHEILPADLFSEDDKLLALARALGSIAVAALDRAPQVKIVNAAGDFAWMRLQPSGDDDFIRWD